MNLKPGTIKKTILTLGLIALAIFLFCYFSRNKTNVDQPVAETSTYEMPTLQLPLSYFSKEDVSWGSVNTDRDSDDKNTWKEAAVDGGYRSSPTTKITLGADDYDQKVEALPPVQKLDQILSEDKDWEWLYKEQIQKYGDLATRFLPGDYITGLEKFDVDGDGKDETIIDLCGVGGNHCPHEIKIIKNGKIIFSAYAGLVDLGLFKSETGNGFYIHWVPTEGDSKWNVGLCCSPGYMSTRFVFEDNKFKPVYEQENLYFKVENTR